MENRIDVEKKYNEWIDKACEFVDKVGPTLNMPVGSMQSDISLVLGNEINIMFLADLIYENEKFHIKPSEFDVCVAEGEFTI